MRQLRPKPPIAALITLLLAAHVALPAGLSRTLLDRALAAEGDVGGEHAGENADPAPHPPTGRVVFAAPAPASGHGRNATDALALDESNDDVLRASAHYFTAPIYAEPSTEAARIGLARRGGSVQVKSRRQGESCDGGAWYAVEPKGYVCTRAGFRTPQPTLSEPLSAETPDLSHDLPYAYAKLVRQGAPRLEQIPDAADWTLYESQRAAATEAGRSLRHSELPNVVREELRGAYFFAVAAEETSEVGAWLRTVRGRVVPRDAVEPIIASRLRGLRIPTGQEFAFVTTTDAPVLHEGDLRPLGRAERYARFSFLGLATIDGQQFVRGPQSSLVARQHVRLARLVSPPEELNDEDRWVHIDLSEQVLVAYEGRRPVYATLISSGIDGHRTPTGLFRVGAKHGTTTMRGPDPTHGLYEVQEVPWAQFFSGDYALHGAYWHDGFGQVRSHGCVNLAPADAHWLFEWTTPELPDGWHGIRQSNAGTWVYVTP